MRLNRPEIGNALNPELLVRLARAWDTLRADPEVRAAVLTGAGDSTFCAGFDLAASIRLFTGARKPADDWDRVALESDRARACGSGG